MIDVYQQRKTMDKEKKSVTVALTFHHAERTLVDEELQSEVQKILDALTHDYQIVVREK